MIKWYENNNCWNKSVFFKVYNLQLASTIITVHRQEFYNLELNDVISIDKV